MLYKAYPFPGNPTYWYENPGANGGLWKQHLLTNSSCNETPIYVDLFNLIEEIPNVELKIDLASQTLTLPDRRAVKFPFNPFSKVCLLNGVDEIKYLLKHDDRIGEYEMAQG